MRALDPRLAFGLVAALYLLVFPYHPGLRSPNELCRLWQSRALVDHKTISLNETMREFGGVGDLSVKDGVYYPSKAPLLSFAGAPIYWALKKLGPVTDVRQVYWSRLFLTIAPALAVLVFVRRFLRTYLAPVLADTLVVTYALGTLAFNYAEAFFSHQVTAVLLFGAFYAAWRTLRGEWKIWGWAVSGAFAGATVAAEYTGALGVVGLAIYVAYAVAVEKNREARRDPDRVPNRASQVDVLKLGPIAALVLLGAAPFLGGLMAYHQAAFGGPFTSGYKYLNDSNYQPWHLGGFLGIRYPDPRAFVLSFFSPQRGLFTLSPFLMLAFFGLKGLWKEQRSLFVLTTVLILGNAYFTSSFSYESWGWAVGPRHLTPLIPFLLLPAGFALQRAQALTGFDGKIGYGMAAGLCMSSVLVDGVSTFVNYVPEVVSTSIFGLAWPLFTTGYLPPTVLMFLGFPNQFSGMIALLLLAAAVWVVGARLTGGREKVVAYAAAAMVLAHVGLINGATKHGEGDYGGFIHLRGVWITPPPGPAPVPKNWRPGVEQQLLHN